MKKLILVAVIGLTVFGLALSKNTVNTSETYLDFDDYHTPEHVYV